MIKPLLRRSRPRPKKEPPPSNVDLLYPLKGMVGDLSGFNRVMFIDPGLGGTGWAIFEALNPSSPLPPEKAGVIKGIGTEWEDRSRSVGLQIRDLVHKYHVRWLVMEFPEIWEGSALSLASSKSGSIGKLTFVCGCIAGACYVDTNRVVLMSPARWKGQLPKEQIIARIKKAWRHLPEIKDHEGDALGMGLSAQNGL